MQNLQKNGLTGFGLKYLALIFEAFEWMSAFSGLLMLCYNGERGEINTALFPEGADIIVISTDVDENFAKVSHSKEKITRSVLDIFKK